MTRYVKGQSGNPAGRPKGAAGLARYAAEITNDGREMLDILAAMARDPNTPVRERLGATIAVLDRAVGKPLQTTQVDLIASVPGFDRPAGWESLDTHERMEVLQSWRQRALASAAIDTTATPVDEDGDDGT